jgi:hypothetical protein
VRTGAASAAHRSPGRTAPAGTRRGPGSWRRRVTGRPAPSTATCPGSREPLAG